MRNYIAQFNDKNCSHVNDYMKQGLSIVEAFELELKKNRHNPVLIQGVKTTHKKWLWMFTLLKTELITTKNLHPSGC